MTTPQEEGVHRLVDMTVEEVSLVDRAANRQRFLVVKKDGAMTQTDKALDDENSEGVEPDDAFEDAEEQRDAGSPLDIALSALESLTSMVDLLSSMGADGSDPRLASLAQELRRAAEEMLGTAGANDEDTADEAVEARDDTAEKSATAGNGEESTDPPAAAEAAPQNSFAADVAAAKTALTQLAGRASRTAKAKVTQATAAQTPAASTGTAASASPASDAASEVVEQLSKLADAVRSLTDTVQAQSLRLGKVEKQFGLPNSATVEPVVKGVVDDTGWPLDLNRPMDRHSVDKSLSFHDL